MFSFFRVFLLPCWGLEIVFKLFNFGHENLGTLETDFRVIFEWRIVMLVVLIGPNRHQSVTVAGGGDKSVSFELIQFNDFEGQLESGKYAGTNEDGHDDVDGIMIPTEDTKNVN